MLFSLPLPTIHYFYLYLYHDVHTDKYYTPTPPEDRTLFSLTEFSLHDCVDVSSFFLIVQSILIHECTGFYSTNFLVARLSSNFQSLLLQTIVLHAHRYKWARFRDKMNLRLRK